MPCSEKASNGDRWEGALRTEIPANWQHGFGLEPFVPRPACQGDTLGLDGINVPLVSTAIRALRLQDKSLPLSKLSLCTYSERRKWVHFGSAGQRLILMSSEVVSQNIADTVLSEYKIRKHAGVHLVITRYF